MLRLRLLAPLFVVGLLGSGFLVGQDKKTDNEPIIVKARLPRNYSKLGLSDKQKKKIYQVQAKYEVQIEKLSQQIAALKAKEKAEVEGVLTAAQKSRLRELMGGAGAKEAADADEKLPLVEKKKK